MENANSILQTIRNHVTILTGRERSARESEETLKQDLQEIEDSIYKYFKEIRDKVELIEREQIRSLRQKNDAEVAKLEQRRAEYQRCIGAAQKATEELDITALENIKDEIEKRIAKPNELAVKISFNPVTSPEREMRFECFTLQPGFVEVITISQDQAKELDTIREKSARITSGQVAVMGQLGLKYKTIFNGRTATDKRHCWFTGAVILGNGNMLLADRNNNKIKLFSDKCSLLLEADTGGAPFDLALMDNGEVAVTITKERRVRFFEPNTLSWSTVSIDTDQNCVGIDYQDGELFVMCESSFKMGRCIKVYDHMKVYVKKISISDSMTEPVRGYLKVAPSSGLLYFVRNEFIRGNFICCCDGRGNILYTTKLQFRDESPALAILSDCLVVGLASWAGLVNQHG
ncbi:uncharacterized protein LOC117336877 [Pecten maximus]|uniref:uncharacterized protein LOC117336877 n=1 Tax=Pecten maximus TaxID=6579 RepID=UPI00145915B3|nr:uncharacterized protein LOC117336877 [Pecten maximus]